MINVVVSVLSIILESVNNNNKKKYPAEIIMVSILTQEAEMKSMRRPRGQIVVTSQLLRIARICNCEEDIWRDSYVIQLSSNCS